MPWHLQRRDGRWCVIKDADGSSEGCHDARVDAIKQQRALYANEARTAALYATLDAQTDPEPEPVASAQGSELVRIEIGKDDAALTASVLEQMERMSERQSRTDEALIAALSAIGQREPTVTVEAAQITVEPTPVTVEAPSVTVEPPVVNVTADVTVPAAGARKRISFERNLEGRVVGATVEE